MTPGKYNIVCPQGTTYNQQFTYSIDGVAVNLTSYTARMQVREKYTSKTSILDLSTENGGIDIIAEDGAINVLISETVSALIPAKEYVYDLELISPSDFVYRLIEGKFIVTPEVTK
jgi:hypothetical protein